MLYIAYSFSSLSVEIFYVYGGFCMYGFIFYICNFGPGIYFGVRNEEKGVVSPLFLLCLENESHHFIKCAYSLFASVSGLFSMD